MHNARSKLRGSRGRLVAQCLGHPGVEAPLLEHLGADSRTGRNSSRHYVRKASNDGRGTGPAWRCAERDARRRPTAPTTPRVDAALPGVLAMRRAEDRAVLLGREAQGCRGLRGSDVVAGRRRLRRLPEPLSRSCDPAGWLWLTMDIGPPRQRNVGARGIRRGCPGSSHPGRPWSREALSRLNSRSTVPHRASLRARSPPRCAVEQGARRDRSEAVRARPGAVRGLVTADERRPTAPGPAPRPRSPARPGMPGHRGTSLREWSSARSRSVNDRSTSR